MEHKFLKDTLLERVYNSSLLLSVFFTILLRWNKFRNVKNLLDCKSFCTHKETKQNSYEYYKINGEMNSCVIWPNLNTQRSSTATAQWRGESQAFLNSVRSTQSMQVGMLPIAPSQPSASYSWDLMFVLDFCLPFVSRNYFSLGENVQKWRKICSRECYTIVAIVVRELSLHVCSSHSGPQVVVACNLAGSTGATLPL